MAALKCKMQEQIRDGCGMAWNSYKLENFVQKFSDRIFNFQEKMDDLLCYTDKRMTWCAHWRLVTTRFREILEKVQKLADNLDSQSMALTV